MPSYLLAGLALLAGHNTFLQTAAHDDNKISNRMQEFVADQQPISINFAHPMKNSRKWGTATPKLENGMPRMRRHDRRQASAAFTSTATQTSSSAGPTPTAGQVDTSVYKAGLGWTSESGTQWGDFTPDSSSTVAKRDGSHNALSNRMAGSVIGWTYDWNSHIVPGTPLDQLDFVPMAWGPGSIDAFAADSANFDALGVSHLLSFNEPDQQWDAGGSNTSPSDAATSHQRIFNSTLAAKYRIGSPAVARGSKWWMEQWITACAGACAYDFVPLHFYGTNADDMISYIEDFLTSFGKPVWVTEYACLDFGSNPAYICTMDETMEFNRKILAYMYNEPRVERYAAFGSFTSWAASGNTNALMDGDGHINDLGRLYATTT
ncbi:hypothetical protein QFC24_007103 [Naganishia onofrii]|uniref:Uncharacterized protein n=1 Tax=Naganishia onofrii TaxID=1851511 RepID=A0ACC2WTH3_9TREE|nr:hypothetical protein QFC24_007103 [Naganishia onofrii]